MPDSDHSDLMQNDTLKKVCMLHLRPIGKVVKNLSADFKAKPKGIWLYISISDKMKYCLGCHWKAVAEP
jgi:predicted metal-binding membrane protein